MEDSRVFGFRREVSTGGVLASGDGRVPLQDVDTNVDDAMAIVVAPPKVSRVTWTESHKMALLCQCRMEACNPITKRTNEDKSTTWANLRSALMSYPERLFTGFAMSVDSMQRRVESLIKKHRKEMRWHWP